MSNHLTTPAFSLPVSDVLTAPELGDAPGIRHGFFTRRGGVSTGLYAGLNMGLGSSDDPAAVRENRARAASFLGQPDREIATLFQVHSAEVAVVTEPLSGDRPRADGLVTRTPGLAIGVLTADCGPILFADAKAGVVGAAHAGWRGAAGGVIEATIAAMEGCGAQRENIMAVLGPTITQENYEVGTDMRAEVLRGTPDADRFFAPGRAEDKAQFDLPGFILARLGAAGVAARFVGRCTYGEESLFFSFRRATHRGEADYGRQLAAIAIDR
jgi:YfiH family protein